MINYKRHLKSYVVTHRIIEQAAEIQKQLVNNSITSKDHIIINKLDVILTKGMNKVEQMIKKIRSPVSHLNLQFLSSIFRYGN